ncbi:hypothetical protein JCM5296_003227 [Sporobolomyces johnsonii]
MAKNTSSKDCVSTPRRPKASKSTSSSITMPRGLKEYHDFYMTESAKIKDEHPNMGGKSVQKKVHALWKASPDASFGSGVQ